MLGAFESTYQPAFDVDVVETTQHDRRWRSDLDLLASLGVRGLRYPLRWHRIEPEPGRYDWTHTDAVLHHQRDLGLAPIVDLLHHTSYPAWIGDLSSPAFGPAFLRFAEAVADRYPWLPAYTVCNEPFTTVLMCGELGLWAPHRTGLDGFVELATNILPVVAEASRRLERALPQARHVHVEAAERHTWEAAGRATAELYNDRRFLFTDLLTGTAVDPGRPSVELVASHGGEALLEMAPGHVDVIGIDYYAHNQWHWTGDGKGTNVAPAPPPLSDLIVEYAHRYDRPCSLTETNLRGFPSDRASWLRYAVEQCELAADRGVEIEGCCWFPTIDSADWASQLVSSEGAIDPVGVFWLDEHFDRHRSSMSRAFALAAGGATARQLPAYRFRPPVTDWIAGWMPHMAHWDWIDPPADEHGPNPDARAPDVAPPGLPDGAGGSRSSRTVSVAPPASGGAAAPRSAAARPASG
ncbi:MAG: hypothetical protein JWO77_2194 [Ilumatobacteraceae bacterium]|nr:hypothetical protein [Ilumatobacteraceae bacterium]